MTKEEKELKRKYSRNWYNKLKQQDKGFVNRHWCLIMLKSTKKHFYASKQAIPLNLVNRNNIVLSYRVKQNNDTYKYFIGYLHDDDAIKPLCIVLPQMSGYIKYFENGGKNMSFKIEDEGVYLKYNEIWNKINTILKVKFHSQPIYDAKYIKTKVKTFNNSINTFFSGDEIPKDRIHYVCISSTCIDSVLRSDKKNYQKVFLEQCKCKIKKERISKFY